MTELAKAKRNYVAIEQFYVVTELARIGKNFCHDRGFLGHNRVGHDREKAMHA